MTSVGAQPKQRGSGKPKAPVQLSANERSKIAAQASYIGSPEHKRGPSFSGPPRFKSGNSICPTELNGRQEDLTTWLREALQQGHFTGPIEAGFPRYVFARRQNKWLQARLTNPQLGQYKGWPVEEFEVPKQLRDSGESVAE